MSWSWWRMVCSSEIVEDRGDLQDGRAEIEGPEEPSSHGTPRVTGEDMTMDSIIVNAPREKLAQLPLLDPSQATVRALAERGRMLSVGRG